MIYFLRIKLSLILFFYLLKVCTNPKIFSHTLALNSQINDKYWKISIQNEKSRNGRFKVVANEKFV